MRQVMLMNLVGIGQTKSSASGDIFPWDMPTRHIDTGEKIYVARSVASLTGKTARWNLSGVEQL